MLSRALGAVHFLGVLLYITSNAGLTLRSPIASGVEGSATLAHDDGSLYSLDVFVASGSQAHVWKARDLADGLRVILRFPRLLCESKWCRVGELDERSVQEFYTACSLASAAARRLEEDPAAANPRGGFARCLKHLPKADNSMAFEVWEFAGDVTLSVGLFMSSSKLGGGRNALTISEKRTILDQLTTAVSSITTLDAEGSNALQSSPCCCREDSPQECSPMPTHGHVDAVLLRPERGVCPSGYRDIPANCGPIVHHDLTFDNVVLNTSTASDAIQPVIIDFGAATRCWDLKSTANAYTREWVPFWQEDDPGEFDRTSCFAYDIYDIGLMRLVVELLRDLPPDKLLCDVEIASGRQTNISSCTVDATSAGPGVVTQAFRPIVLLIRELRKYVLDSESMSRPDVFIERLMRFVFFGEFFISKEVWRLQLTMPAKDILHQIFSMLRECPNDPRGMSAPLDFQCRASVLRRCLKSKPSWSLEFTRRIEYEEMCENTSDSSLPSLREGFCVGSEARQMWALIIKGDEEGLRLHSNEFLAAGVDVCKDLPTGVPLLLVAVESARLNIVSALASFPASSCASRAFLMLLQSPGNGPMLSVLLRMVSHQDLDRLRSTAPNMLSDVSATGDIFMFDIIVYKILQGLPFGKRHLLLRGTTSDDAPLLRAAGRGWVDGVKRLLQYQAQADVTNSLGDSALALALKSGSVETARMLALAAPQVVNAKVIGSSARHMTTLLHRAVASGNQALVEALLEMRADASQQESQTGQTPLHAACLQDALSSDLVELLAAAYPRAVNMGDWSGLTPLHILNGRDMFETYCSLTLIFKESQAYQYSDLGFQEKVMDRLMCCGRGRR